MLIVHPIYVTSSALPNILRVCFSLFLVVFLWVFFFFSRNCLHTTPVCLKGRMAVRPAMRCAWLQLWRKVRTTVLHENKNNINLTILHSRQIWNAEFNTHQIWVTQGCEITYIIIHKWIGRDYLTNLVIIPVIFQKNIHCCFSDCAVDGECDSCCGSFNFEDKEFTVKRGDYAPIMEKVCYYLQEAQVNTGDVGY